MRVLLGTLRAVATGWDSDLAKPVTATGTERMAAALALVELTSPVLPVGVSDVRAVVKWLTARPVK